MKNKSIKMISIGLILSSVGCLINKQFNKVVIDYSNIKNKSYDLTNDADPEIVGGKIYY